MAVRAPLGGRPLVGSVAIVTGASSGIGAAVARELAQRGATLVLAARRVEELNAQAEAIRIMGAEVLVIPTDVARDVDAQLLVDRTMTTFGRIDVLVNNAGVGWQAPLAATDPGGVAHVVGVNLLGAMLITRAALPCMLARSHGSIVFVGSLSGRVAMEPLYSASKYGLRGFSLALRRQMAGTGISVSLVSAGNINTAMTQHVNARIPGPELVATTVANLIRHPRREVVIPRRHYAIAWLEQLFPTISDYVYQARGWSPVREEEV